MIPLVSRGIRQHLQDTLHQWCKEMQALLVDLVSLESPSTVPSAQEPVLVRLQDALVQLNWRVRRIPGKQTGGHLLALPQHRLPRRPYQLLLGHCDTVWPLGTLEHMPCIVRGGQLAGPGVYDMKAGLVQLIYAVKALQVHALEPVVTPVVFINSDEEIGSYESTRYIRRLAYHADRAWVMEPSLGPQGHLKTARKGVGRFIVRVQGQAAHAGLDPGKGASAILELSFVIQQLFALNDPARGITVNVGTIDGGIRSNVVAPESRADVDVRVLYQDDVQRVENAILHLQPTIPGTRLSITGRIGRPPMEKTPGNQHLWQMAQQVAEDLAIPIQEGTAGGGSDGNTTSLYTPTLDGLGAVGDGAHAINEFIYLDSLVDRGALLASLLLLPPLAGGPDPKSLS